MKNLLQVGRGNKRHIAYTAPDKTEGYEHDVLEVYNALIKLNPQKMKKYELLREMEDLSAQSDAQNDNDNSNEADNDKQNDNGKPISGKGKDGNVKGHSVQFDDHTFWESADNKEENETWTQRMVDATETANLMAENFSSYSGKGCGAVPLGAQRIVDSLLEPQTNWREVLENFIQEEINDYTFNPPDRRFDDSPFFLPDFNEKETTVKNVVFLVDTSASMSDEAIRLAYSEINGAIEQFGGKFEGYLAFGDTQAYDLIPISGDTDIIELLPKGGGGTDFERPINFVLDKLDELPSCMIYITDGECHFPEERITRGVPFLWLITTDVTPPWGKVGRIILEN